MGSMLSRPWDTWIQHAVQQKERRRTQHAADSVLLRLRYYYEDWSARRYIMDGRYPRTRRPKKRHTSRERARRTVTVVAEGTYGSQLFKSPRFIPRKLREPNANLRPSYVRTPWAVVKGESSLKRAQEQLGRVPAETSCRSGQDDHRAIWLP